METPTFKTGDRVRLKAYANTTGLHYKYFNHNNIGIVGLQTDMYKLVIVGKEHIVVRTAFPKNSRHHRYPFSAVPAEDLELMPERQVHVVKDGKVYELRQYSPDNNACRNCSFYGLSCEYQPAPCLDAFGKNFQEVSSGKLVS